MLSFNHYPGYWLWSSIFKKLSHLILIYRSRLLLFNIYEICIPIFILLFCLINLFYVTGRTLPSYLFIVQCFFRRNSRENIIILRVLSQVKSPQIHFRFTLAFALKTLIRLIFCTQTRRPHLIAQDLLERFFFIGRGTKININFTLQFCVETVLFIFWGFWLFVTFIPFQ